MLNQDTLNKLREMKLASFATELTDQSTDKNFDNLSFEERIGILVDSEYNRRKNNKINRLLKYATLDIADACIEDIEYHADRKLDASLIAKLSTCGYIQANRNIILLGATGAGKSYIACAFGNKACRKEYRTKYIRLPDLLVEIEIARAEGVYKKYMTAIAKLDLLILDEWLLLSLTNAEARNLLEVIEIRQRKGSIVFCSQFQTNEWHQKFKQDTLADAILDRIIHNSYEIIIQGKDSMRKKKGIR